MINIHEIVDKLGYGLETIEPMFGTNGIVYFLKGDLVLKMTRDENEISVAKKLLGADLKYLAEIHEIHEMNGWHVIIREKLEDLSYRDIQNYQEYDKSYFYFAFYEIYYLTARKLLGLNIKKKTEEEVIAERGNRSARKWAEGIVKIANEAREYGVEYPYDHMYKQNIGIKKGRYACFDLIDKKV